MKYQAKIILVIVAVLTCVAPSAGQNTSATPVDGEKLKSVQKIYLGDLRKQDESEKDEDTNKIREKIRQRLIKSKRFTVVDTPEQADASLIGTVGVFKRDLGPEFIDVLGVIRARPPGPDSTYEGYGDVKLVDPKTKEMIWSYEYKPGIFGSPLDSVAKNIVNHLLQDAKRIEKNSK